jgi:hypothetical protein
MYRRMMFFGILAVAALLAGGLAALQRRRNGRLGADSAVQWPFDRAELRSLMDRVVAEQRERINSIEDVAGRGRAQAFLEYYERRRQAVAS